jgi:hypothetical protein
VFDAHTWCVRRLAVIVFALLLLVPAGVLAASSPAGSVELIDARGTITIKGRGALLGRIDSGSLQIVDLTLNDPWSPRVNGVPRGRVVGMRGKDITIYIPGGRYRLVVRGDGINISARGQGIVTMKAIPDPAGTTGTFAVDDDEPEAVPDVVTRVAYGLDVNVAPVRPGA